MKAKVKEKLMKVIQEMSMMALLKVLKKKKNLHFNPKFQKKNHKINKMKLKLFPKHKTRTTNILTAKPTL